MSRPAPAGSPAFQCAIRLRIREAWRLATDPKARPSLRATARRFLLQHGSVR